MKKHGDTFIAENVVIYKNYINIYIICINNNKEENLLNFSIEI